MDLCDTLGAGAQVALSARLPPSDGHLGEGRPTLGTFLLTLDLPGDPSEELNILRSLQMGEVPVLVQARPVFEDNAALSALWKFFQPRHFLHVQFFVIVMLFTGKIHIALKNGRHGITHQCVHKAIREHASFKVITAKQDVHVALFQRFVEHVLFS